MTNKIASRSLRRVGVKVALCLFLTVGTAWACLWDSDTLETELQGVPDRRTLVSNRWHRHGLPYYQERIDRLRSKADKTPEEFDDLAVAYERKQEFDKALAVLDQKLTYLKTHPNEEHLYRYHANYGTVLAHSGRYEEALVQLERALEINPEAHFGREEFQVHLIRYVAAAKKDPNLWVTHNFLSYVNHPASLATDHRQFLSHSYGDERANSDRLATEEDLERAYQGISGMLRFGGREGPELYRALGDVSLSQRHLNVAWYFYHTAVNKKHPASERILQTLDGIEKHWDSAEPRRLPNEDHFELVYANSLEWQAAFQRAELLALEEGKAPARPEVLKGLLAEADAEVPALELTVYKNMAAALLGTVDPNQEIRYKPRDVVPLLVLGLFALLAIGLFLYDRRPGREPRSLP